MILDVLAKLSVAQAVTSADAYSDFAYDMGNVTPKRRLAGKKMSIVFIVTTAAGADGASFTDTFDLMAIESAAAALTNHVVMVQRRVPAALLVAGAVFELPIPADKPTLRYIGARYELGTDDTLGVSAYLIPADMVQAFTAYANNYTP